MELFLNILWLAIALAGLCIWRTCWANQPRERMHASWRQWTAFACALVLLFFMVSLTDDLHSELVVFEECAAGRRHTTWASCPVHAPKAQFASGMVSYPARVSDDPPIMRSESVTCDQLFFRLAYTAHGFSGRAPPTVSL